MTTTRTHATAAQLATGDKLFIGGRREPHTFVAVVELNGRRLIELLDPTGRKIYFDRKPSTRFRLI